MIAYDHWSDEASYFVLPNFNISLNWEQSFTSKHFKIQNH